MAADIVRRNIGQPMGTPGGRFGPLVILALLLGGPAGMATLPDGRALASSRPVGVVHTLKATTSTGRQGAYYLPAGHASGALPVLVILHGTGGKGSLMALRMRALADRERFIVVAPDSPSPAGAWLVGDHRHVMNCVREVLGFSEVQVDRAHVLVAGFSVGGAVAAHLASHEDLFDSFAVLHGHVGSGLGPRRPRGWLSTGDRDRQRTPTHMRATADELTRGGFLDIEVRVFPGDHSLGEQELSGLVQWWLRRSAPR